MSDAGDSTLYTRALGMMQRIAYDYANGTVPRGPERGIVSPEEANDAVMQVFAVVDAAYQAGQLDINGWLHVMLMLMAIREALLPLPDLAEEEELLRQDLVDAVLAIERGRQAFGTG